MIDREKVTRGLNDIGGFIAGRIGFEQARNFLRTIDDALALLKWQEEREKAICKGICDFIRGSCSTDTYEDKEYVCHVIQQMFIKGRSAK